MTRKSTLYTVDDDDEEERDSSKERPNSLDTEETTRTPGKDKGKEKENLSPASSTATPASSTKKKRILSDAEETDSDEEAVLLLNKENGSLSTPVPRPLEKEKGQGEKSAARSFSLRKSLSRPAPALDGLDSDSDAEVVFQGTREGETPANKERERDEREQTHRLSLSKPCITRSAHSKPTKHQQFKAKEKTGRLDDPSFSFSSSLEETADSEDFEEPSSSLKKRKQERERKEGKRQKRRSSPPIVTARKSAGALIANADKRSADEASDSDSMRDFLVADDEVEESAVSSASEEEANGGKRGEKKERERRGRAKEKSRQETPVVAPAMKRQKSSEKQDMLGGSGSKARRSAGSKRPRRLHPDVEDDTDPLLLFRSLKAQKDPRNAFILYLQYLIRALLDNSYYMDVRKGKHPEVRTAIKLVEDKLVCWRESLVGSSAWHVEYLSDLKKHPGHRVSQGGCGESVCAACNRQNHTCTHTVRFCGPSYEPEQMYGEDWRTKLQILLDSGAGATESKVYHLGRFCSMRSLTYHRMLHYKLNLCMEILSLAESTARTAGTRSRAELIEVMLDTSQYLDEKLEEWEDITSSVGEKFTLEHEAAHASKKLYDFLHFREIWLSPSSYANASYFLSLAPSFSLPQEKREEWEEEYQPCSPYRSPKNVRSPLSGGGAERKPTERKPLRLQVHSPISSFSASSARRTPKIDMFFQKGGGERERDEGRSSLRKRMENKSNAVSLPPQPLQSSFIFPLSCICCQEGTPDALFIHEGEAHQVCCLPCGKQWKLKEKKCPVCLQEVEYVLRNLMMSHQDVDRAATVAQRAKKRK